MAKEWLQCFEELEVPHTQEPNLISTLGDPVKIRSWQVRVMPLIFCPQSVVAFHLQKNVYQKALLEITLS